MDIMTIMVSLVMAMGVSLVCSVIGRNGDFSMNIFMATLAICIAVLVWIPVLPSYTIIISVLLIVAMLFSSPDSNGSMA